MTGYELRIWRKGLSWDQERAAEEVGVSLRTYKRYEKKIGSIPKLVELATCSLSLKFLYPELQFLPAEIILFRLKSVVPS